MSVTKTLQQRCEFWAIKLQYPGLNFPISPSSSHSFVVIIYGPYRYSGFARFIGFAFRKVIDNSITLTRCTYCSFQAIAS